MVRGLLRILASLKLSVVLLALAMVLIYVGTWAQIDNGIYQVQKQYFHTWIARVPLGVILPRTPDGEMLIPGGILMPGGYTVGLVMLVNLLANWFTRYQFTWKKIGIHLIHLGIVLLLIGEVWTSFTQVDSRLILQEGQTRNFTEDPRRYELAVIDRSPADHDYVVSFRHETIHPGAVLNAPESPVSLRIDELAINSTILGPMQRTAGMPEPKASAGRGVGLTLQPMPPASGVQNAVDIPSAYVTVLENGKSLGTYLLSLHPAVAGPQQITLADGRELWLELRNQRYLKPYQITLLEFRHDRYPGTEIPRNFSSRVRLVDPEMGIDREELIKMNHPLRHRGETFYQASFDGDSVSILQVVRNPAMYVPYIACAIGSLGLVLQSGLSLQRVLKKRRETSAAALPVATSGARGSWTLPLTLAGLSVVLLVLVGVRSRVSDTDLAQVPVYFDGRLQPIDSVARNSLRALNGKASTETPDGRKIEAVEWLWDLICRPEVAMGYPTFRIDNPEILAGLKLDTDRKRFTPDEIQPHLDAITMQVQAAGAVPSNRRDVVQRNLIALWNKLTLFSRVADWANLYLLPPDNVQTQWHPLGPALQHAHATGTMPSDMAMTIATALTDIREHGMQTPSDAAASWLSQIRQQRPGDMAKVRLEVLYNRYEPFLWAMVLYVLVFLLACVGVLTGNSMLWRCAMALGVVGLILHTTAMGMRIYIQGRPPVTNLYSSAVFIGWGAVLLSLLVERSYRNGIAISMASLVGVGSLIVAHNLAQGGDTMPSMQAVLDSNFWLTTHVLAITFGYSAAFLAGAMGIAFIVAAWTAERWLNAERKASLSRMIYGITVFALVFSFIGTLLGGIWADQSWGRFWGWDPKENGAALIVLWLSIMLHARFIGLRERGLAVLAVFANVVTAWSWFGTNMLGVGLHSYGFMDSALMWLLIFVFSQLLIMGLGMMLPKDTAGRPAA